MPLTRVGFVPELPILKLLNTEEGLLLPRGKDELDQRQGSWGSILFQELKRLSCIAAPMVAVNLSQFLLQVGHLGGLALSSTAIATSLANVTGFSLFTISTLYAIPNGIGAAASTRVSNELGAGNHEGARIATCAAMFLTVAEASTVAITLFCCCHVFGYLFTNEEEVINYVRIIAPLLCLSECLLLLY